MQMNLLLIIKSNWNECDVFINNHQYVDHSKNEISIFRTKFREIIVKDVIIIQTAQK